MLGFVQSWFKPAAHPIGVDFGTDCLRMAQVDVVAPGEFRLVAAASADVPSHVRQDPSARLAFFTETVRDLLAHGNFRGRRAILTLPAASMFIQHLRMAKMDEADLKKALPWEARGKLPIDPAHALLRHLVAGEVYQDQEPKSEVILMAASRELVNQLLDAAGRAKLDVVGMNVEPRALVDCFGHLYRRKSDAETTSCFVDIGLTGTRAVIARGTHVLFARSIPIGGDAFNRAVAAAMKVSTEDAKLLRIKVGHAAPVGGAVEDSKQKAAVEVEAEPALATAPAAPAARAAEGGDENSFALLGAGLEAARRRETGAVAPAASGEPPKRRATDRGVDPLVATAAAPVVRAPESLDEAAQVEQACREPLNKLIEELDLCRRYYESAFPSGPVGRLVFVGGEARHRGLCQQVARGLMLAAQVGDPLVRMGRISDVGIESGIDRRQPQPAWAVAIGLSMGPVNSAVTVETK